MVSAVGHRVGLSDYQINGGRELWLLPVNKFPLFVLALGLIAGIILQTFLMFSFVWLLAYVAVLSIFAVWVVGFNRKVSGAVVFGFLSFALLGAAREYILQNPGANHISTITPAEPILTAIKGEVVSYPADNRNKNANGHTYSMSFYLDVKEVRVQDGFAAAQGRVYGRISSIPIGIQPEDIAQKGDIITVQCRLSRPVSNKEKWQFNFGKYLHQKGVEVCANGKYPAVIRHKKANLPLVGGFDITAEDEISQIALTQALTLGRRANLPEDVVEAFRVSGLAHLISLSGMHVAIITGGLWLMLKVAGVRQRTAAVVMIIAVAAFLYVIDVRPPAVRACIIAFVFSAAKLFCRRSNGINSLSLAAIITLLINPLDLFTPGWQLSFICVFGIILLTMPITRFLSDKTRYILMFWRAATGKPASPRIDFFSPSMLSHRLLVAVSSSLAAWLVSTPIIAYHFGAVYPLSWAYTVLLAPLLWLTINISFLSIIFGGIFDFAARGLAATLIDVVAYFAKIDVSEILVGFIPLHILLLFMGAMLVFGLSVFLLNKSLWRVSVAMAVVSIVLVAVWDIKSFGGDKLRLTLLPAGHGQCAVLEFSRNKAIMLDCGSKTFDDFGRRVAAPFLRSRRLRNIDTVIISHPHSDHISGLDYILEKFEPQRVLINQDGCDYGLQGEVVFANETIFDDDGKWILEIIPPLGRFDGLNDNCLIVLIDYKGTRLMLPSDIEKQRQEQIIEQGITTDILFTPHHDSKVTTLDYFAEKVGAKRIISTEPQKLLSPKRLVID